MTIIYGFILTSETPDGNVYKNRIIAGTTIESRDAHKLAIIAVIPDNHTFSDFEVESVINREGFYKSTNGETYRIQSVKDRDSFGYSQKLKRGKLTDDKIVWFWRDGISFNKKITLLAIDK